MAGILHKPLKARIVFAVVCFATAAVMAAGAWHMPLDDYIGPAGRYIAIVIGVGGLFWIARNA